MAKVVPSLEYHALENDKRIEFQNIVYKCPIFRIWLNLLVLMPHFMGVGKLLKESITQIFTLYYDFFDAIMIPDLQETTTTF